jgi:hypothetical protein
MPKKQVGKIYTAKNGAKYKILPNGRAKFVKRSSGTGKKGGKLGGSVRVAGSVSVAGGLKKRKY